MARVPVMLSCDEVYRLIRATRTLRGRTITMLMYGAGLRVSEVLRLRARDIDGKRGVISVQESKGRRSRCVMLGRELLVALRTWWKARPNIYSTGLLFPGAHGLLGARKPFHFVFDCNRTTILAHALH